jgi:hypothetical protein
LTLFLEAEALVRIVHWPTATMADGEARAYGSRLELSSKFAM